MEPDLCLKVKQHLMVNTLLLALRISLKAFVKILTLQYNTSDFYCLLSIIVNGTQKRSHNEKLPNTLVSDW